MKKIIFYIVLLCSLPIFTFAENYIVNGEQKSNINYEMTQKIIPAKQTKKISLSYVVPQSFDSPTFKQNIKKSDFIFSPEPSKKEEKIDRHGNKIIEVNFLSPNQTISASVKINIENKLILKPIESKATFPLDKLPDDIKLYLSSTEQVPSTNDEIHAKAEEITNGAKNQFDAVQKILTWVIDHMHYVLNPESYDAMYSLKNGKGNCQNYSHLAAALMRSVGIPAKIVNGVTLKEPYEIVLQDSKLTVKLAEGRHSWIEVYFPDYGWVPFDPQSTNFFVSNRFIRIETGLDNNETCQDGLLRWTQPKGSTEKPKFEEIIASNFFSDEVHLSAERMNYGPKGMLLSPKMEVAFEKIPIKPPVELPEIIPEQTLKELKYTSKYIFGNLDFPENFNFLLAQGSIKEGDEGSMEMKKNFMVETAEYVTTQGRQYAQVFVLKKPMLLEKIGLALHKFGGNGQLWVELIGDEKNKLSKYVATSDIIFVDDMKYAAGYSWVDFDFTQSKVLISPGKYWIIFNFTGQPIINWFFSYGKPVGPQDGTRIKTIFDSEWNNFLSYEFNYKISGLIPEK
ncbi:MAG: transglutaminase domain-containing protein [Desulfobacterales bacterium]|nr:transglutaminase domain-containing protein [Desulfobacterales bacterium]